MICLLGIRRNTPVSIREKFNIINKNKETYYKKFKDTFKEIIILSTCNRTEVYFNVSNYNSEEEILKKIFEVLMWNENLKEYIFITKGEHVYRHIFEVCCGFHSKITGEDQILGQVKNALLESRENKAVSLELSRLFQMAVTCGKEFRKVAKLYEIPVSSVSIVVNETINKNLKRYMVLGYGEIGKLCVTYLLGHKIEKLYIVVRNPELVKEEIHDDRIQIINFEEKKNIINQVECIIGCTSAPHVVVSRNEISEKGPQIYMYDLAVPRDFDEELEKVSRIKVYNIDDISVINDKNEQLRIQRMNHNKYILKQYFYEYIEWLKLRSITEHIKELKSVGQSVSDKRITAFKNKMNTKNHEEMAETLIKSTSDYYINNAIDLLKEETLKGREEECLNIIKRIFKMEN